MSEANRKAIVTYVKFVFWYAVAATWEAAINQLPNVQITGPWAAVFVPVVGGLLKATATWVKTREAE